jgi:TolB-like protein/class 3 adenylate cyclase
MGDALRSHAGLCMAPIGIRGAVEGKPPPEWSGQPKGGHSHPTSAHAKWLLSPQVGFQQSERDPTSPGAILGRRELCCIRALDKPSKQVGAMASTRRLAAILAADVAGYSRLMGQDEEGTHDRLKVHLRQLVNPKIKEYRGRIVKNTGDGMLAEFSSVVNAVRCAVEVQRGMANRNAQTPEDQRIVFRVGINLGDVIVEPGDIYGDGVNIASRLEALAEPGGICISDDAFRQVRVKVDVEFIDIGEQELKNIAQPVHAYRVLLETAAVASASRPVAALPLPDNPSIAVLPFLNMSGDPEQEYFVDGMVEEIITALSRIRWLFVIARNSTFIYKGQAIDVKRVGRELGVRYVLQGSVRKARQQVRITGQLIDALTGTHLWANRFDGSLEDIFELQDRVAVSVAGVIEPALQAAEMHRSAARPMTDLSAYDLYLRALAAFYPITKERVFEALGWLEQAIAIDRHYGPALSWAAVCHLRLITEGWAETPETTRRNAGDLARQALQARENDPRILANAAFVLAGLGEDIGAMMGVVDRALALNPSFARGWSLSGVLRLWAGQSDLAIEHLEISLRLSPHDRTGVPLSAIGMAYFFKRRFDEAAAKLLLAIQDHPGFPAQYRSLAACYAHMGRLDEAHAIVAKLRAMTPLVVPGDLPYRNRDDRELFLSGLRLAAGEST